MTITPIRAAIVAEKLAYIRQMLDSLRRLPLSTFEDFVADSRTAAAAESYLRRALESLFDLGRHILAKGFGSAPGEYKETVNALVQSGVLSQEAGKVLRQMAGYRNRMVHFYHEITVEELFHICRDELVDVEMVSEAFAGWLCEHSEKIDNTL